MKRILSIIFLVGLANTCFAQTWKATTATVTFKIKMLGSTVDGSFKGFSGKFLFDPNNLKISSLSASVDVNTVFTDNSLRDRHLKEKEYLFNAGKYPVLKMTSTNIEKDGNNYIGYFDLTMKGITKNIKLPFSFKQDGEKASFQGSALINRKDWSVGGSTLGMSSDVTFTIAVNAIKE